MKSWKRVALQAASSSAARVLVRCEPGLQCAARLPRAGTEARRLRPRMRRRPEELCGMCG